MSDLRLTREQEIDHFCSELRRIQKEFGDKAIFRYVMSGYHPSQDDVYTELCMTLERGDFEGIAQFVLNHKPIFPMSLELDPDRMKIDAAELGLAPIFMLFSGDRDAPDICIQAMVHFMLQVPPDRALLLAGDEPGVQIKAFLTAKKLGWSNIIYEPADTKRWGLLAPLERDKSLLSIVASESAERIANNLPEPIVRSVAFTMEPRSPPNSVQRVQNHARKLGLTTLINPRDWRRDR